MKLKKCQAGENLLSYLLKVLLTETVETVGIALSSLFTKCNLLLFTQKLSVLFHNLIAFHVIFHELI